MKKNLIPLITLTLSLSLVAQALAYSGEGERLIKTSDSSAVYVIKSMDRYVFPDTKTYESWHGNSYTAVQIVTNEELSNYQLKGNATYKPASLIKIQTDPKVYEVLDNDSNIAWVESEQSAQEKFGANWASLVQDVPAAFFVNYTISPSQPETPQPETPTSTPPVTIEQTPAQPNLESTSLIRITNNQLADDDADIAWNGDTFGIIYVENGNLYYSYIDSSSNLGATMKVNSASIDIAGPELIWDGDYFAVVWKGTNNNETNLYFAKIGSDSRILTSETKVATVDTDSSVSIATYNDYFAVAWDKKPADTDAKEIFFATLDDVGKVIKSTQVTSLDTKNSFKPEVVWNNNDYGVFWQDARDDSNLSDGANYKIYYTHLDTNATKAAEDMKITEGEEINSDLGLSWDGTTYPIVFYDAKNNGYYFNRVYQNGTKVMANAKKLDGPSTTPGSTCDVSYLNNYYYITVSYKTSEAKRDDGNEMYLLKVPASGDKWLQTRLTYNPNNSLDPAIITSSEGVGIIWTDGRGSCSECSLNDAKRNEIYFLKVDE